MGALEKVFCFHGGFKALWVAHRAELLVQAEEAALKVGLVPGYVEEDNPDVLLSMIQSTHKIRGNNFTAIVVDESHHQAAATYERLREEKECGYYLGLTATPTRLDGKELGFNVIIAQESMLDLVNQGYLARPEYYAIRTRCDYRLQLRGNDFTRTSLNQLHDEKRNRIIVDVLKDSKWGATILYAVNIEHASALTSMLSEKGVDARVAHGGTHSEERESIKSWFESTERPVLVNCELYTEGMDLPTANTVALARPTASESLYMQMVGRGCRIAPGKSSFAIVDFIDMSHKYALLSSHWALDIGAEVVDEETQEFCNELEESREEEQAEQEIVDLAGQLDIRRTKAYREAKAEPLDFEGFLRYGSKFWKKDKLIAVPRSKYKAIRKMSTILYINMNDANLTDIVSSAYAISCTDGEFSRGEFVNMCWAYVFWCKGHTHFGDNNITWNWTPLKQRSEEENKELQDQIVKEIEIADKQRIELNSRFPDVNNLFDRVVEEARKDYGDYSDELRILQPISFKNCIMHVRYDGRFQDDIWSVRNIVEEMLEIIVGRYISLKVDYMREDQYR